MMAKRGLELEAVHFTSPPYTSELAKEKVVSLAKIIAGYTGGFTMYVVPFTEQQLAIRDNCPEEHLTLILRRMMMRVTEKIAKRNKSMAIVTGESLGQVASQTIEGMTSSNSVVEKLPVLRPLVGFDKNEIIDRSVKIGTYDISILPYEDCCTVFLPDYPAIRPKMEDILKEESKLDVEGLIRQAFESLEKIEL
jgi:thiamine biosynthesis protein ThiI